jgi:hypothetical protein
MSITVAFESKAPHTTPWLSVEWDLNEDDPQDLFDSLAELGWKEDARFAGVPPIGDVQETAISPPKGSDLFGGWTEAERRERMPEVRRLLRTKGFDRVPWNRLTLADML